MKEKGKFADWTLKDWVIQLLFISISFSFLYGAVHNIRTGFYLHAILFLICSLLLFFLCLIPFFSKQIPVIEKKGFPLQVPLPETIEGFVTLAKSLTLNDSKIIAEISECLENPEGFLQKLETNAENDLDSLYEELLEEYEVYKDYARNPNEPFLQGGLLQLASYHYIARFDWKADKETFLEGMQDLLMVKRKKLRCKSQDLSDLGDVEVWCYELDQVWKEQGYRTVTIENDSDDYNVGIQKVII